MAYFLKHVLNSIDMDNDFQKLLLISDEKAEAEVEKKQCKYISPSCSS